MPQIAIGLDACGLGGFDEAVESRAGVCSGGGIREQPRLPADYHHAIILPISGVKLKFTIVGIRFTVDVHALITASSARLAA
jgi:hypothetical protein